MPLYEYQCPQCGRFELIQKFSDAPLNACPTCGREVQKLLSAPAIQFKGSGWYITDYARKSSGGEAAGKGEGDKPAKTGEGVSKGDSSTSTTTTTKDGSASSSKDGSTSSNSSSSTAK